MLKCGGRNTELGRDYLFVIPQVFIGNCDLLFYFPFLDVIRRSFTGAVGGGWVGLENYRQTFSNSAFHLALGNTIKFELVCIPLMIILSLGMALFVEVPGFGDSILAGSLTLGLLCVPLVIRTTEEALKVFRIVTAKAAWRWERPNCKLSAT